MKSILIGMVSLPWALVAYIKYLIRSVLEDALWYVERDVFPWEKEKINKIIDEEHEALMQTIKKFELDREENDNK
jgi:hypothetical protein